MKKSLLIAASLATMVTLSACGPGPAGPSPSPSASPSESATPTPGPSESPSETPMPSATPTPAPSQSALPTPTPPANLGFSLATATATKTPNFRYNFVITGTGLGAVADYKELQIRSSDATIKLVENGTARNTVEVSNVEITPTQISFTWLPPLGSVTNQDLLDVTYILTSNDAKNSSTVRLSVN